MKKRILHILCGRTIFLVVFFIGLLTFLYPLISSNINHRSQTQVISNYDEKMDRMEEGERQRQREEAVRYNAYVKDLEGSRSETITPREKEAMERVNIEMKNIGEVLGYVEIPRIDIELPIYYGESDEILSRGAGLMPKTSLPVGGDSTHCVISARRGLPSARMFRDLDQMEIKDVFFLHAAQETLAYEVESVRVVLPTDISALEIEEGRDLVTLITCDPYMINSHRMLVRAHRTEYNEGVKAKSQDRKISPLVKYREYLFVIVFFAILILFIKFIQTRVKKRTYEENWK